MIFIFIGIILTLVIYLFFGKEFYGVTYIENFFTEDEFKIIKNECKKLEQLLTKEKYTTAAGRLTTIVPKDTGITNLCEHPQTKKKLKLPENTFPSDVPIEYRKYPIGSSMDWHNDTLLYTKPQYEVVYTIKNTSDSKTCWFDPNDRKVKEITTKPNSAIVIKADDVQHCVTPICEGERDILKFAYTETLEKAPGYFENAANLTT